MKRTWLLVLAATPLLSLTGPTVMGGCGCGGSGDTEDASDGQVIVDRVHDVGVDSTDAGVDAGPCGLEGYVLDDAYDTRCGFCYASAPQYLPPPIQWEPCDSVAFPQGVACQQMKRTWPASTSPSNGTLGQYFEGATKGFLDSGGHAVLAFGIASNTTFQEIVAPADGPVLTTMLELDTDECLTVTQDARDGYYAMRVYDAENNNWQASLGTSSFGGGAIGGDVTNIRPRVYTHYHAGYAYSNDYAASRLGLVEGQLAAGGTFTLYDWNTDASQVIYEGVEAGMDINDPAPAGNAIFFDSAYSLALLKEQVWTPDAGVNDIVAFGNDTSQGAGPLNSDGVDMVWMYGSGRDGSSGQYPTISIMTSPFATQPSDLQPRRLRSEGPCIGTVSEEFFVGCGFASLPT